VTTLLTFPSDTLAVRPWQDDVIDRHGFDPRAPYVEQFWLGVLGPSTTLLLRHLADRFDLMPDGFDLPLAETARALGLGDRGGRHSPFLRTVNRTIQFQMATPTPAGGLAVRRRLPPLARRHLERLPPQLRAAHDSWQRSCLDRPSSERLQHRCRRLALSLLQLGEDAAATERQLLRWGYQPASAAEATAWAARRLGQVQSSAGGQSTGPVGPEQRLTAVGSSATSEL
jgi:hypothetical protein